jgi:hypothetical protein
MEGRLMNEIARKVGTVDKKVVNLKAYTYESNVMLLVPHYMHDWWGCKPEYLANKTFVPTMEGYGKCSFHTFRIAVSTNKFSENAFAAANTSLRGRPSFVALHNFIKGVKIFNDFTTLEYNGLGSACLAAEDHIHQVPGIFKSPSRVASKEEDNILFIVETTMMNLCPSLDLVQGLTQKWTETTDMAELIASLRTRHNGPNVRSLLALLRKLLQLEKQIELQLQRYLAKKVGGVQQLEQLKQQFSVEQMQEEGIGTIGLVSCRSRQHSCA